MKIEEVEKLIWGCWKDNNNNWIFNSEKDNTGYAILKMNESFIEYYKILELDTHPKHIIDTKEGNRYIIEFIHNNVLQISTTSGSYNFIRCE